ncbi:MAG: D-aminoacyl-tRNA deacylase [Bacillota bacterium]
MRAIVERVRGARVEAGGRPVASIERGLLVFVAVERGDGRAQAEYMAEKLAHLRVFQDGQGKLNDSVLQAQGQVLLISNFTVVGDASRGRRPSFDRAAPAQEALVVFEALRSALEARGVPVAVGSFGDHMEVFSVCDGPVTLVVETPRLDS